MIRSLDSDESNVEITVLLPDASELTDEDEEWMRMNIPPGIANKISHVVVGITPNLNYTVGTYKKKKSRSERFFNTDPFMVPERLHEFTSLTGNDNQEES
ncbi:hypothetical protein TNCV_2380011 [Trichonephila clavipes]|nr:hypothetical protein TNCV_2380011 [Trichonephila clavipes]